MDVFISVRLSIFVVFSSSFYDMRYKTGGFSVAAKIGDNVRFANGEIDSVIFIAYKIYTYSKINE